METPIPVSIETPVPIPVTVVDAPQRYSTVTKGEGTTLSPTTTEAQDKTTEGQRAINLIWETTQSKIALMVVFAGIVVNSIVIILVVFFNREVSVPALAVVSICLQFLNLTAGIVIGFYFSRTNHAAIGGIGPQPTQYPYEGR